MKVEVGRGSSRWKWRLEEDQVDERGGRKRIKEMEAEVGRGSRRWKWRLEEDQGDESGGGG